MPRDKCGMHSWKQAESRYMNTNNQSPVNPELTISAFENHIREKYSRRDIERGSAATFVWFIEEIGELATAIQGQDRNNQQEEFADVFAWLCTLANIHGIDMARAIHEKYFASGGPEGFK